MARTILHYGTEYLGTPAQLDVIPEGVLIVDPDTNTIKIGNGIDAGGVTVQADVAFSDITGTPTTLAGYGITDAQSILVSGTNIKTVNGTSLLGSGDVTISGGASTLGALSDVNNTAPSFNNQPLVWDQSNSEWKPAQDLFVDDLKASTKLTLDGQGTYVEWIGNLSPPFYTIKLNITGNATQNETITLPNATGTVALTSDIPAGTTINNNADNRIITGSATADTLNAESDLIFQPNFRFKCALGTGLNSNLIQLSHNTAANRGMGLVLSRNTDFTNTAAVGVLEADELSMLSVQGMNFFTGGGGSTGDAYASTILRARIDVDGHFVPGANNTYDLGASGNVWANVYANTISGNLDDATVTTGLSFGNIIKAKFGDSDELQIFSNSSQAKSFITTDTNILTLSTNNKVQMQSTGGQISGFVADIDGSTDLYYNFNKKFETTNTGVAISGIMQLPVLSAAPSSPADGMTAIADGTSWDPLSNGVKSMVVYLDSAWRQIAIASV